MAQLVGYGTYGGRAVKRGMLVDPFGLEASCFGHTDVSSLISITQQKLLADLVGTSTASSSVTLLIDLKLDVQGTSSFPPVERVAVPFRADLVGVDSASALLSRGLGLPISFPGTSTTTALPIVEIRLSSDLVGTSTTDATEGKPLKSVLAGTGSVTATASVVNALTASATGAGALAVVETIGRVLYAAPAGTSTVQATTAPAAAPAGLGTVTPVLTVSQPVAASNTGTSTATATYTSVYAASMQGTSTSTADSHSPFGRKRQTGDYRLRNNDGGRRLRQEDQTNLFAGRLVCRPAGEGVLVALLVQTLTAAAVGTSTVLADSHTPFGRKRENGDFRNRQTGGRRLRQDDAALLEARTKRLNGLATGTGTLTAFMAVSAVLRGQGTLVVIKEVDFRLRSEMVGSSSAAAQFRPIVAAAAAGYSFVRADIGAADRPEGTTLLTAESGSGRMTESGAIRTTESST